MITEEELLPGEDGEFVINLYLAVLGRWPDEGGLAHHMAFLAGRPDQRKAALRNMQTSEEARLRGHVVPPGGEAANAGAAQARLRLGWLLEEVATLRSRPEAAPDNDLREEMARLAAELARLRAETRERLAALEAGLANALPLEPRLSAALSVDFVQDQIAAAQLRLEARLRALEARMLRA